MLIGNLGKDPVIRTANNGNKIASFSIATSERWNDKLTGEKKEKTEWHNIVVYSQPLINNLIEKYIKKGSRIYIEGALQTRKWTDNNNAERYTTEVVLQNFTGNIVMLGNREERNTANIPDENKPHVNTTEDDDIPF